MIHYVGATNSKILSTNFNSTKESTTEALFIFSLFNFAELTVSEVTVKLIKHAFLSPGKIGLTEGRCTLYCIFCGKTDAKYVFSRSPNFLSSVSYNVTFSFFSLFSYVCLLCAFSVCLCMLMFYSLFYRPSCLN